jgi:hypothetical protein
MAEPSRVIHIRNVGHEISEVSNFFFYIELFGGISRPDCSLLRSSV